MKTSFEQKHLSPRELITDNTLRSLQADECGTRKTGRLSDQDAAIMCMILPDLCGELIARRAVAYSPAEMVTLTITNADLRWLAQEQASRAQGTLSASEHRFLAITLPAICYELLHLRVMMSVENAA